MVELGWSGGDGEVDETLARADEAEREAGEGGRGDDNCGEADEGSGNDCRWRWS